MNIILDNVEFRVRVTFGSLGRSFQIMEGPNTGTAITGRQIRDIIGTGYSYKMMVEPNPQYPEDYDAFFDLISMPTDYHTVRLPYGQSYIDFDAIVESGEDSMGSNIAGVRRWHGLSVTFKPLKPQREVGL